MARRKPTSHDASAGALLAASSADVARRIVAGLEAAGFSWLPLGGKEGNFGLVNIGSDPALAFIERVTNAIDGVIERAARDATPELVAEFESPREAAGALFGIDDGRLSSLDDAALAGIAAGVTVSILDGSSTARPTLEVRDNGVGISRERMPRSILDLAGSNKLDKPYLAGAYGQGGSTTFGFTAGGTVIASSEDGIEGGVTLVRYRALDPRKNKNGRYEYLVDADGRVAAFDAIETSFARGTLVRHFDYELPRHTGAIETSAGLAGLAGATLFDPVLPVRLVDGRSRLRGATGIVFAGAARPLGRAGPHVQIRQSIGVPLGPRGRGGLATIRYWLLDGSDDAATLRPDDRHVVFITNFGQTHDAWPRSFVVDDLHFPFLKTSLIIQVELDGLTPMAKRELLSTTRDRLKRGSLFTVFACGRARCTDRRNGARRRERGAAATTALEAASGRSRSLAASLRGTHRDVSARPDSGGRKQRQAWYRGSRQRFRRRRRRRDRRAAADARPSHVHPVLIARRRAAPW